MVAITLRSAGSALTHTQLDNNFSNLNQFSSDASLNTFFYAGTYSGSGASNVFMGVHGIALTTGTNNTALGISAGDDITTGSYNVCLGTNAGSAITTHNFNVKVGYYAGYQYSNANCIHIGAYAGGTSSGADQTHIGHQAGETNFDLGAVCIGYRASQLMEGTYHVSVGSLALQGSTSYTNANYCTGVGAEAGKLAYGTDYAVAVGAYGGYEAGHYGTYVGYASGFNCNNGQNQTYIGAAAGRDGFGTGNVFIGGYTGYYVNGTYNTSLGYSAGNSGGSSTYYSGDYNLWLGCYAKPSSSSAANECTIGAGSGLTGQITRFRIPGTATDITSSLLAHGGDIAAYYSSDIRLKENIHVIPDALSKVNSLRGVTYDWTAEALEMRKSPDLKWTQRKEDVGVIAQEVEKVLPELVLDRADGYKGIKYERLTALLIEAVKELSARVEELENGIS